LCDFIGVDANEGLKHPAPYVGSLELKKYLNQQEIDVLKQYLPHCRQWTQLAVDELRESGEFDEEEWGEFCTDSDDSNTE